MHKIDMTQELKDIEGKTIGADIDCLVVNEKNEFILDDNKQPLVMRIKKPENAFTLKKLLLSVIKVGEANMTPSQKADDGELMFKIYSNKELELSNTDVERLKKLAGLNINKDPFLVRTIYHILDGK